MKNKKYASILNKFPKTKILVLGDLMLDRYIWGGVERISPEAPVPVVRVKDETTKLGGAANVAAGVAALGANVSLVGTMGQDQYADLFKKALKQKKISISGIVSDIKRQTTVKTRVIASSQQVVRVDREDSDEIEYDLTDQIIRKAKKYIKEVDAVIISDYGKGVITHELLSEIIPYANKLNKFIAVDPKEVHFMNYKNVSVITPNHHEAGFVSGRKITDDKILSEVGWNLLDLLNLKSLLITQGDKGMSLFEKDRKFFQIPAESRTVYDVTGAGDTVIATLTVAAGAGASMKDAAFIANVAAGIAIGKMGTAQITKNEIEEMMNSKK